MLLLKHFLEVESPCRECRQNVLTVEKTAAKQRNTVTMPTILRLFWICPQYKGSFGFFLPIFWEYEGKWKSTALRTKWDLEWWPHFLHLCVLCWAYLLISQSESDQHWVITEDCLAINQDKIITSATEIKSHCMCAGECVDAHVCIQLVWEVYMKTHWLTLCGERVCLFFLTST